MILSNYYKALGVGISGEYISLKCTKGTTGYVVIYNSTNVGAMLYNALNNGAKEGYAGGSHQQPHIVLGTGNEPPALSDYKLSGSVVTGITTSASFSGSKADDGTYDIGTVILGITNKNGTDITIGEVGIVYQMNTDAALLERTVLDTPITIPAGGVGQVTYTIRMNYPTA